MIKMECVIDVEPCELNSNLNKYLVNRLSTQYLNKCNEFGIITKIYDKIKIKENHINHNGFVSIVLEYEFDYFRPEKEQTYDCVVIHILSKGIIATIHGMKIFIPINDKQNSYDSKVPSITYNNKVITISTPIRVKLTNVRLQNNVYEGIGTLI